MIDVITYALLKNQISAAAISSAKVEDGELIFVMGDKSEVNCGAVFGTDLTITSAQIVGDELIFTFSNGSTLNAGKLPSAAELIDDTTTSSSKTYSSRFINNIFSYDLVLGGGADQPEAFFGDVVNGGDAGYAPDQEILVDASTVDW